MDIRNIAIIAHVDHGKTTLVDTLLQQSGIFRDNQVVAERALDSGLERERGITILAKCTSVVWKDTRINIVDTPGHADFGGEVERILSMVDGVIVLVDAAEGPMPQTKFVTAKALSLGLRPIVVVNKADKAEARPDDVHTEVFDLFSALDATDEQLDFPTLFAAGRDGWAVHDLADPHTDLAPLFDLIVEHVSAPEGSADSEFRMLGSLIESNPYLGRLITGRVSSGVVRHNTTIQALNPDGSKVESFRITKLLAFRGLERVPVDSASAGDIVAIAGMSTATVADTLADPSVTEPLTALPVDPPTLAMTFAVNSSPLVGREGSKVTSRVIRDRLMREMEGNVAIKITETEDKDAFEVAGRGELQLGVLIETMRREGFELSISRPRVLFQKDPDTGKPMEPIEEVQIDVDDDFTGIVIEKLSERKGEVSDMRPSGGGKTRITMLVPARGLIGYHGQFMTDTRGTGIMNRAFSGYALLKGDMPGRANGVMISTGTGDAVPFALWNLEDRGDLFVIPGVKIYAGMIVGEHSRGNDLDVNPLKAKQLTNIRAAGKDESVRLTTPRKMSLEQAIAYIDDDELVEVTPENVRLRKRYLDVNDRKKAARASEKTRQLMAEGEE
jgi:GTP-binding protein